MIAESEWPFYAPTPILWGVIYFFNTTDGGSNTESSRHADDDVPTPKTTATNPQDPALAARCRAEAATSRSQMANIGMLH